MINQDELHRAILSKLDVNVITLTLNFPSSDGIKVIEGAFRIRAEYSQLRNHHNYVGDTIFEITNLDLDKICPHGYKEYRFYTMLNNIPDNGEGYELLEKSEHEDGEKFQHTWKQFIFKDISAVKNFVINLIDKIDKNMSKPQLPISSNRTIVSAKDFFDRE